MRRKGREEKGKKKVEGKGCFATSCSSLSRILNRLEGDGKKVEGEGESSDKDSSSLFCALLVQKKVLLLLKREKGLPSLGKKVTFLKGKCG